MAQEAIEDNRTFKVKKSRKTLIKFRCVVEGCDFEKTFRKNKTTFLWEMRDEAQDHSELCNRNSTTTIKSVLVAPVAARIASDHPSAPVSEVITAVQRETGVRSGYYQTWRALDASRRRETDHVKDLSLISGLCRLINERNPGSICTLDTNRNQFTRVFLCLAQWTKLFCLGNKLIFIDGTFLTGPFDGILLSAISQDGNGKIFHVALAIVSSETGENWAWFFSQLKQALLAVGEERAVFVSDRGTGLLAGLNEVFPQNPRISCTAHIVRNMRSASNVSLPIDVEELVWKAARSYSLVAFNGIMEEIGRKSPTAMAYLLEISPPLWSVYGRTLPSYKTLTSNAVESFHSAIRKKKADTYYAILQCVFERSIKYLVDIAELESGLYKRAEKRIKNESRESRKFSVLRFEAEKAKVHHNQDEAIVDLEAKRCTCGEFQDYQLPCRHAMAFINFLSRRWQTYASSHHFTDGMKTSQIVVVPILRNEIVPVPLVPPIVPKKRGPKRKNRIPSRGERRSRHCGLCGQAGHNRRRCSQRSANAVSGQ